MTFIMIILRSCQIINVFTVVYIMYLNPIISYLFTKKRSITFTNDYCLYLCVPLQPRGVTGGPMPEYTCSWLAGRWWVCSEDADWGLRLEVCFCLCNAFLYSASWLPCLSSSPPPCLSITPSCMEARLWSKHVSPNNLTNFRLQVLGLSKKEMDENNNSTSKLIG